MKGLRRCDGQFHKFAQVPRVNESARAADMFSCSLHADDKPAFVLLPYYTLTIPLYYPYPTLFYRALPYPTMARIFIQHLTVIET